MKGWPSVWVAAGIIGCSGADDEPPPPANPPAQGVVLGIRTPDGAPVPAVEGYLGNGDRADPDASGFVYYVGVPPGRIQVSVSGEGFAVGHGAPTVRPGGLSFASVVPLALEVEVVDDPAESRTLTGDGLRVEIPGGFAQFDYLPAVGPWSVGRVRVREADRASVPGDLLGLSNDTDERPIVIDEVVALRGWNALSDASFPEETPIVFTVDLAADSPLLDPGAEPQLYVYSGSRTHWTRVGQPVIDVDARTASWEGSLLGWWAIGREVPEPTDRSCVTGRVVDAAGLGLQGAEVRLVQEGTIGVDRVSTEDGRFCLPIDPGAGAALGIAGVDATRSTLFTWSGAVTGGAVAGACGSPACVDLGTLGAEVWPDADGDRSWAGPGGDCDDGDAGVNPNPTLGDGSYCGDRL